MNNKIYGLVYGQAIGDAVGAYTKKTLNKEFKNESDFKFPLDYIPPEKRDPKCLWTDDTNQLILIIIMLVKLKGDIDVNIFAKLLYFWVNNGFQELDQTKGDGVGGMTFAIVNDPDFLNCPQKVAYSYWSSRKAAGNGGLMRSSIMGISNKDKDIVIKNAKRDLFYHTFRSKMYNICCYYCKYDL